MHLFRSVDNDNTAPFFAMAFSFFFFFFFYKFIIYSVPKNTDWLVLQKKRGENGGFKGK